MASRIEVAATYNFATDGGTVGADKTLARNVRIPANTLIDSVKLQVITPLNSSGAATVSLGFESATDLLDANPFGDFPASPGLYGLTPLSSGEAILTTAVRSLRLTIAGAALTAGKFRVLVGYGSVGPAV
jgi:hypothetical protein